MLSPDKPGDPWLILYDMDDTLVHTRQMAYDGYARLLAQKLSVSFEQASELNNAYADKYGDGVLHTARHFKVPDPEAFTQSLHAEIQPFLASQVSKHITPDPTLRRKLVMLKQRGHRQLVLTQSYPVYARAVLRQSNLAPVFKKKEVITRHCVGGHGKETTIPYEFTLERVGPHAYNRRRVMVDDKPVNLEAAGQVGFITVLVGVKNRKQKPDFVHAAFATVHDFQEAFLAGTFQRIYA